MEIIKASVTREERKRAEKAAKDAKRSLSSWIRDAVCKALAVPK